MNRSITYKIETKDNHKRISAFLTEKGYTKRNLNELRGSSGSVLLNHESVYVNQFVHAGDILTVHILEEAPSGKFEPIPLPFQVVYEDEDLVVVNKPANMPSHPSLHHYTNTLANAAMYYFRDEESPYIYRCINRLDKDTTGLTILVKNPVSAAIMQKQMRERKICRTYTAIVEGTFEEGPGFADTISLPIGRRAESIIERCVDLEQGEPAVTHYRILSQGMNYSLVELTLETGRTHQIRVHMSAIGHPLIGDGLYNPSCDTTVMSRQALHAGALSFTHPITGDQLSLHAALPEDMVDFLAR